MSYYTPTTEHVLKSWLHDGRMSSEFHLWLTEVKAQAWQEGTHAMAIELTHHFGENHKCVTNPYRQGEEQ